MRQIVALVIALLAGRLAGLVGWAATLIESETGRRAEEAAETRC